MSYDIDEYMEDVLSGGANNYMADTEEDWDTDENRPWDEDDRDTDIDRLPDPEDIDEMPGWDDDERDYEIE